MKFKKTVWGWWLKFFHTKRFWLKILRVKGQTSYQSHDHRTEYFIGIFKVDPLEKHRLNKGLYIEFAVGEPSEEDVIRWEDKYGRKN